MNLRFAIAAGLVLVAALSGRAKEPRWYQQPGTPLTLASAGLELRTRLPQGWAFTAEQGFVPPPALASSCRVRNELYAGRNWDRQLVSELHSAEGGHAGQDARMVLKIGGHPAVLDRYGRDSLLIRTIYINLSELQPDSGAIWNFEGRPTAEGGDCELQFLAIVNSSRISRR